MILHNALDLTCQAPARVLIGMTGMGGRPHHFLRKADAPFVCKAALIGV